jgi:hypothetical protein
MASWRKLYNEELQNLYCSPKIIKGKGKVVPVLSSAPCHEDVSLA